MVAGLLVVLLSCWRPGGTDVYEQAQGADIPQRGRSENPRTDPISMGKRYRMVPRQVVLVLKGSLLADGNHAWTTVQSSRVVELG